MGLQTTAADADFLEFARRIKTKTGLDLLSYKQDQVVRRLTSLKVRKGFPTFVDFFKAIDRNNDVYREFMNQLTINVTEFYRNPERWKVLVEKIVPDILTRTRKMKCWSAACSTGEESYSLLLALSDLLKLTDIEVFATDLDPSVVAKAKLATYTGQSVREVPAAKLAQYFSIDNGKYTVSDAVKKRVRFGIHDLLVDPYESGFDLIICRNVMIYFKEHAKEQLFRKFSQSLNAGGYLFVGGTEQIKNPDQYGLTATATFFYKKK